MSAGRAITHVLNPRLVTKLFSTSRKEVKHVKVLPEIKPAELSQEARDGILSRLTV